MGASAFLSLESLLYMLQQKKTERGVGGVGGGGGGGRWGTHKSACQARGTSAYLQRSPLPVREGPSDLLRSLVRHELSAKA